ncbi:hypothetical protein jhhlp_008608 [Lomentospora prolificans]|uniref:Uncharacterized protein n=1 Tax=Lomentospora prolificans TaxID=41688 RepID=A0A2N3MYH6_9PEZI|nr:hypothetical protein jhhlp_008608 [Lomentospora prolificans]
MVTKSKLKLALAYEKGVDFAQIKEKRRLKALRKSREQRKAAKAAAEKDADVNGSGGEDDEWEDEDDRSKDEDEDEDEDEDDDGEDSRLDIEQLDDSDSSDSEVEMEERLPRPPKKQRPQEKSKATAKVQKKESKPEEDDREDDEDEEEEEEDDDDDIPVSDLEDLEEDEKEDLIPHTRLTINNTAALLTSLNRIRIPTDSSAPFATHQSITSSTRTADDIPNVSDDLQRELQFYKQSRDAVLKARSLLLKEGVPFSRPNDYFAEMVKSDEHVEKIRQKLIEEATSKKAAAEARKLRDLKKFGKQVQVAKLQERQKAKKDSLEKIKALKRKRQESGNADTHEADELFDVAVDNELRSHGGKNFKSAGKGRRSDDRVPNPKRQKKNEKYGFGGKKRHSKSGDAFSSADLSGFSVKKNKAGFKGAGGGKAQRPGKARRKAMAGRN